MAKDNKNIVEVDKNVSKKNAGSEKSLEERVKELEIIVAAQKKQIEQLMAAVSEKKTLKTAPAVKAAKKVKAKLAETVEAVTSNPVDSEGREILKTKRSKYNCATSGKYECDECGKPINRGETIRFVNVKYADGTQERYQFCCGKHRNAYCDGHGIPQDKVL